MRENGWIDCFAALPVLVRVSGLSPCSGFVLAPLFVVLSPWAGSRSRLVLALGLRRAVAPRKGNCWVRIDLAILGLLAQAIVIEIRNASLDFNCHESAFRKLDLRSVLLRATPFQRSISLA